MEAFPRRFFRKGKSIESDWHTIHQGWSAKEDWKNRDRWWLSSPDDNPCVGPPIIRGIVGIGLSEWVN